MPRFRTGPLTPRLLGALATLEASAEVTDTLLVGRVVDRAALYGYIARIEALGLELVELQRLSPPLRERILSPCGREGEAGERDSRTTRACDRHNCIDPLTRGAPMLRRAHLRLADQSAPLRRSSSQLADSGQTLFGFGLVRPLATGPR